MLRHELPAPLGFGTCDKYQQVGTRGAQLAARGQHAVDLVLKLAKDAGITLYEELFTEVQLWQADEAFITNTTMEIMPVTRVDDQVVGMGAPGELTRRLASAYKEEVRRCLETR